MAVIQWQENQLHMIGKIDFNNANQVLRDGVRLLQVQDTFPVMLDLSELQHGNTLALAICIQWLRVCPKVTDLRLVNVPVKMLGIIRASHLEHLVE